MTIAIFRRNSGDADHTNRTKWHGADAAIGLSRFRVPLGQLSTPLDVENRGRFVELRGTLTGRGTGTRFDDNTPTRRAPTWSTLQADKFDFALSVVHEDRLLVARKA